MRPSVLACALAVLFTCNSFAQNPSDSKLQQIESQLRDLTKQVEELRKTNAATASISPGRTNDAIARIREEGLEHSQLMPTLTYLTEAIGPRLTGSPNLRRANTWTRDKLLSWGLTNALVEPWGYFGTGWSLKRFSVQVVEPQAFPLIAQPKAWSPGLPQPITAEIIHVEARTDTDLEKYKGRLKGMIVLTSNTRDIRARFEPPGTRLSESNLLRLANAAESGAQPSRRFSTNSFSRTNTTSRTNPNFNARTSTNGPVTAGSLIAFLMREGAALQITTSPQGDGGTLFVSSATLPSRTNQAPSLQPRAWATNAAATVPQIVLASEDYNRLLRMIQLGEKPRLNVEFEATFHRDDLKAYNTTAEIPGTDLKDELVMLGAHLDSWHSGTGATDNGAGVAAVLEAVRIIKALDLKPRRTIRVALWTGEEQGLLGSKAYVTNHFGYSTNNTKAASSNVTRSPREESNRRRDIPRRDANRNIAKNPAYEKFSAYFNLDNGTGKIRGVHLQGNENVRPLFRKWLQPFSDLGADTLTIANTGGTDHLSFDAIGLPGFQFIQDPIEYNSRTHHSNADVLDRIQADDLKQAATILAAFVYNAAMQDQKVPRKPAE